jgi:hypothetical protein
VLLVLCKKPQNRPCESFGEGARPAHPIRVISATVAECLERARRCERSASLTNDERDRKFLLWKAQQWMKLAAEKERQAPASSGAHQLTHATG